MKYLTKCFWRYRGESIPFAQYTAILNVNYAFGFFFKINYEKVMWRGEREKEIEKRQGDYMSDNKYKLLHCIKKLNAFELL